MRGLFWLLLLLTACGQPPPGPGSDLNLPSWLGQTQDGLTAKHKVTLRPHAAAHLCLSAAPGPKATLAECDHSEAQQWSRYGHDLRGLGDKCLAIDGDERDGARLVMTDCATPGRHPWVFGDHGLQTGQHGDKCLDVTDGHYVAGNEVQVWTCVDGDEAQGWGWVWALHKLIGLPDQPASTHPASKPPAAESHAHEQAPAREAEKSKTPAKPAEPAQSAPQHRDQQHPLQAPQPAHGGVFGPSPAGTLVAPYFYAWESPGMVKWLMDGHKKAGLQAATMAFGLSGGGCKVKGFEEYAADIKAFQAAGGTVVLSFGGQAGTYTEATCKDVDQLAAAFLGQSKAHNTKLLDFDVEGDNLDHKDAVTRLLQALVRVQKQQHDTYVSFTLPVDPEAGVPGNAFALLQEAAKVGVKVSRVNLMAMDYGRKPKAGQTVSDLAISAAQATGRQMKKIWPAASQADINHAIGITPMIGQNDGNQDGPFLVSDAQKVAAWAKANGIGHLAYWAFQRDNAKPADYNDHSLNQKADFEYYKAFTAK